MDRRRRRRHLLEVGLQQVAPPVLWAVAEVEVPEGLLAPLLLRRLVVVRLQVVRRLPARWPNMAVAFP